jgi:serine/threonine protein phosphatase 1
VCKATSDLRFTALGTPGRIWAISAIHAETDRLMDLHDGLYDRLRPGDRIVYHGNYMGFGRDSAGTVDELLTFRRMALARPGTLPKDFIYLRGGQEEMWQKLLQLQFAPNPAAVLRWMLDNGLSATLCSYGISPHEGLAAANEGVMSLTRWTNRIRELVRRRPGHDIFSMQLRRAAHTDQAAENPLLFVHAGINPAVRLDDQGDSFWWAGSKFSSILLPYEPYKKVIRGFDPAHGGLHINCVTATIDGGCGFGGNLVCAGFDANGNIFDMIEA